MADFLNEQEQVDAIKNWWKKNGISTVLTIVVAIAVVIGWQYYKRREAAVTSAASISYQVLLKAQKDNNDEGVIAQAKLIKQSFTNTPYAVLASLFLAKEYVSQDHLSQALTELAFARKHAGAQLKPLVDLRLARVHLALNQYNQALTLVKRSPKGYESSFELVKGEIYQAQGNVAQARQAYTQASHSDIKDASFLRLVQMKLNNLPKS